MSDTAESILRKLLYASTPTFGPDDWVVLDAAVRLTDEERAYLTGLAMSVGQPVQVHATTEDELRLDVPDQWARWPE